MNQGTGGTDNTLRGTAGWPNPTARKQWSLVPQVSSPTHLRLRLTVTKSTAVRQRREQRETRTASDPQGSPPLSSQAPPPARDRIPAGAAAGRMLIVQIPRTAAGPRASPSHELRARLYFEPDTRPGTDLHGPCTQASCRQHHTLPGHLHLH